ncbi:DUF2752 domain-containing protein [Marinilabiliaceae bacterium JC017]|nr:DUF2752 domain-containing protein [Marinilabiliaceae bacterium JC017]
MRYQFKKNHLEAWFWLVALISLAFTTPGQEPHFTLCPIKNLGFDFCPGCGLGHAIMFLFHGQLANSWAAHPLGIPAVIILLWRSISLLKRDIKFSLSKPTTL